MPSSPLLVRFFVVSWISLGTACAASGRAVSVVDLTPPHGTRPPALPARESDPADASTAPNGHLLPGELALVTRVGGKQMVVLDAAADEAWRATPLELTRPASGGYELHAAAALGVLPATHRMEGESFTFYRGDQIVCSAKLGALSIAGVLEEPGIDWSGSPQHKITASPQQIANEAWSFAAKWLVAEAPLPPECANATWARQSSLPPPTFAAPLELSPETTGLAAAMFESTSRYVDAQKGYDTWNASLPQQSNGSPLTAPNEKWDRSPGATRFERGYVWRGQSYLFVGAKIEETCSFNAETMTIFRLNHGRPEIGIERDGVPSDGFLVDLNGDGHLEMLSGVSGMGIPRVESFDDDAGPSFSLERPIIGCPC